MSDNITTSDESSESRIRTTFSGTAGDFTLHNSTASELVSALNAALDKTEDMRACLLVSCSDNEEDDNLTLTIIDATGARLVKSSISIGAQCDDSTLSADISSRTHIPCALSVEHKKTDDDYNSAGVNNAMTTEKKAKIADRAYDTALIIVCALTLMLILLGLPQAALPVILCIMVRAYHPISAAIIDADLKPLAHTRGVNYISSMEDAMQVVSPGSMLHAIRKTFMIESRKRTSRHQLELMLLLLLACIVTIIALCVFGVDWTSALSQTSWSSLIWSNSPHESAF